MKTVKDIIARIESFANPEKVLFKKKQFGIVSNNALGNAFRLKCPLL